MTGTDDVKIIEGVIQSYLDGLYESDAGKIAGVFHPTSALTSVTNEGELVITPRDSWLDKVRARPSPKQRGLREHFTAGATHVCLQPVHADGDFAARDRMLAALADT